MTTASIVVVAQKDFCEGGALAVPGGTRVASNIATLLNTAGFLYDLIVFTKDYHQAGSDNGGHISDTPDFVDTWPPHCIEDTEGQDLHPALWDVRPEKPVTFIFKGHGEPGYSGFSGTTALGMSLVNLLDLHGIQDVDVCGIAAEYCVKQTALDAVIAGYNVTVMGSSYTAAMTPTGVDDVQRAVQQTTIERDHNG